MAVSNNFNPESSDVALTNLRGYLDETGLMRLKDQSLSSYNFNGTIPNLLSNRTASALLPGMKFSLTGSTDGSVYYNIISIINEDPDLDPTLTGLTTIQYLDEQSELKSYSVAASSYLAVLTENWSNKYLGTTGWYISNSGNAIFSNVAVRGRIEATEGAIEGNLTLGGSLTASTNTGQLIFSSSGIFGSTASGLFHLDNIDGEVSFTGDITANSGIVKKLTIGAGKSYPITNLVGTASVANALQSGNFILTLDSNLKNFYPGDYFYINGSKTSGSAFQNGYPTTASLFFNTLSLNKDGSWSSPYVYKILTASYGYPTDRYFCRLQQDGLIDNYNFSQVTASSGSINFGYVYLGEYTSYSLSGGTFIDGLVFSTVGPGTYFQSYIPDYIDLSGRFSLGKGKITFDGASLNVTGNIYATGGEISGDLGIVDGGQIYVGDNKSSGQRINIRHTDMTGYSELGFPIFSLTTGSAVSASPLLQSGGFDNLTPGTDPDPPWQTYWGFTDSGGKHTATVDSKFYKHGGQSVRIASSSVSGDVSAMSQRVDKLVPGEEYLISAWVYSSQDLLISNGDYVDIWLLSSSVTTGGRPEYFTSDVRIASIMGARAVPSNVWTKISSTFVVPSLPYQYHRLDLRTYTDASASVWWDTVELTKTRTTSEISGFKFNDGELLTDYFKLSSNGNLLVGDIKENVSIGSNPDGSDLPDILRITGTDPTYRLLIGHMNPDKAGFSVTKTGHMKTGLITSSATYNRTDTTAYVSISAGGVLGRYSSTQRIKYDILPINTLLGPSIDQSKIISSSPSINYRNILSVTPVEYSLIDQPEGRKFGFIAEDVADKLPEIATYDDEGPTYFDMAGLIAATLAVIQDQQKNIEDLQNRMLQLESQLGG